MMALEPFRDIQTQAISPKLAPILYSCLREDRRKHPDSRVGWWSISLWPPYKDTNPVRVASQTHQASSCISPFSVALIKYYNKGKGKEKAFKLAHSLRVQYLMMEKSWWQDLEAAGHLASTVRKQRDMSARSASFLFFITSRAPVYGLGHRFECRVFQCQLAQSTNSPPPDMLRDVHGDSKFSQADSLN